MVTTHLALIVFGIWAGLVVFALSVIFAIMHRQHSKRLAADKAEREKYAKIRRMAYRDAKLGLVTAKHLSSRSIH